MNNHINITSQLGAQSPRSVGGSRCWLMASAAGFAVFATGCGSNESENIGTSQAAFSVSSCASVAADGAYDGRVDPALVTPRSYDNCTKGYVVDIQSLQAAYTGEGDPFDARIAVQYADTPITSKATCEGSRVLGYFYMLGGGSTSTGGGGNWNLVQQEAEYGQWVPFLGGGFCDLGVDMTGLVSGTTYRVAATARTPGNSTRKVSIGTYKPVNVK